MKRIVLCLFFVLLFLSSCQPVNADDSAGQSEPPAGFAVEIEGDTVYVDRIVSGWMCDDTWSGTVYVDETVQVQNWKDKPDFFRNCSLIIEPGTVVFVAAHPGIRFSKGCSCHQ